MSFRLWIFHFFLLSPSSINYVNDKERDTLTPENRRISFTTVFLEDINIFFEISSSKK